MKSGTEKPDTRIAAIQNENYVHDWWVQEGEAESICGLKQPVHKLESPRTEHFTHCSSCALLRRSLTYGQYTPQALLNGMTRAEVLRLRNLLKRQKGGLA